jgi:putative ABC transport system permease protein
VSFLTVVLKNLLRRPARSILTLVGIAIGVAAVVALTSIAWGFEASWEEAYTARGTDLIVTKVTSQSPLPTPFSADKKAELLAMPGVVRADGLLSDLVSIEDSPTVPLFGWERGGFLWDHLRLVRGRWPEPGAREVVVGVMAADLLGKKVGDPVVIETGRFTVCGVFESGALVENGAVVMDLPLLQEVTENRGKVNFLNLRLDPSLTEAQRESLKSSIRAASPGFNAFSAGDVAANNSAVKMAQAMSWATSLLALLVGAVGVMNTVLMSVFERTHEIGVLLAIGWRRGRILRLILYESIAMSLFGGGVGIVLGAAAVKALELTPLLRGRIAGEFSAGLFATALAVALGLGILGGFYPAFRASRLCPAEALRYE